ncbi:class I SAM-dependent methyltransferase [Pelagibius litoralis]|uniref:Class I SAM-dependent methyltransferase n=1 Tax=Pelagibius litoralis TaxID=374515 RepID=A0A967F0Q7_9PROT|nr:class I SAM-dependent methyltransferase [Pelagibius litoralis]NIA70883.1 class I SAM-dependent methyltransferase [Pelagibius litoralis]
MLAILMSPSPNVASHYAREGTLTGRILSALTAAGKDLARLSPADLTPYDQFHSRGHRATEELAQLLSPQADQLVLDLGCGIGGPARWLADQRGCRVVGLDLTEVYCLTARELSARVGLNGRSSFVCGNGLALPFAEAGFDQVWTQHAAMNIADKARLYREVARVLKPGGRFGLYDVMAGPAGDPHFPVPWSNKAEWSHLMAPQGVREAILATGLKERHWRDLTAEAKAWSEKAVAAQQAGQANTGPAIILGPSFAEMVANLRRSLFEDRITVVQAVFDKPG